MMSLPSTAAQWLRELRIGAGLTQEDLATACGITDRTLRSLEAGTAARPRRHTLDRIANALSLDDEQRGKFLNTWQEHGRRPRAYDEMFDEIRPSESLSDLLVQQRNLIRDISLSERTWIGPDRCEDRFRSQRTVQAIGAGVDRYLWLTGANPQHLDPDRLVPTWVDNCGVGNSYILPRGQVKAFEFVFDRNLEPDETYSFGFEYSRRAARRGNAADAPIETETLVGIRAPAALLTTQVEFSPEALPTRLNRVEQPTIDGPENNLETVALSPFHIGTVTVVRPNPGVHGMRWCW